MKKVLFVAYYFPPAGGPGVQRTLKFVRYLPDLGWHPTVISVRPEAAAWPAEDPSMLPEIPEDVSVLRTGSWDPYAAYAKLKGRSKDTAVGVGFADTGAVGGFERFARFVRANLFLPDARVGWVPFARRQIARLLRHESFDAIITSGPPHSTHLVGRWAQKRFGIPWLADFRDPWGELSYYEQLPFLPWSRALDGYLESRTLREACAVVTVSPAVADLLVAKTDRPVEIIPNGFDPADFQGIQPVGPAEFRIVYVGTLTAAQNPVPLWRVIGRLRDEGNEIRIGLVGRIDSSVLDSLDQNGLAAATERLPYVSHKEAISYMMGAGALLLCVPRTTDDKGILTGKLFEYIASGRPVLAFGPQGSDAASVLDEAQKGVMFDYEDEEGIRTFLVTQHTSWTAGNRGSGPAGGYLSQYTRPALAGRLASILDTISRT